MTVRVYKHWLIFFVTAEPIEPTLGAFTAIQTGQGLMVEKSQHPISLWWLFKPKTQMFWTINYNCFYLELKSNNWQNVDKLWIITCGTWHRSVILSGSETKHLKTFLWNYESSSLRKETSHTNSKWYEMLHPFSDWVDVEEFATPWLLIWTL